MTNLKWTYIWLTIQIAALITFLFFAGTWQLTIWQGVVLSALIVTNGQSTKYWERHLNPPLPTGATVISIDEGGVTTIQHGRHPLVVASWSVSGGRDGRSFDIKLSDPEQYRINAKDAA